MSKRDDKHPHEPKNSDEIRVDLEEKRERVSNDVEALADKLSPDNLKAEAKQAVQRTWEEGREMVRDKVHQRTEQVRETVARTEGAVLGFVRENPVPLSLIGVGIGLMIWNSRNKGQQNGRGPDAAVVGRAAVYDGFGSDDGYGNGSASGKLGQLQGRLRDGVASVKHAASDTAQHARQELQHLERQAGEQAQRAKAVAERAWQEQPLVLGAVALGAGLALGLSIPATESEDQLVGQYRDRLLGSVKERARKLEGTAERAIHAAGESLTENAAADQQA
jgi:ElaB/YqjD/DUF883 family membrane-anchored ribosome-binding protein